MFREVEQPLEPLNHLRIGLFADCPLEEGLKLAREERKRFDVFVCDATCLVAEKSDYYTTLISPEKGVDNA